MVFRRQPPRPELQRFVSARMAIAEHDPGPQVLAMLDDVARSLESALDDRNRLGTALAGFDLDTVSAELKRALRDRPSPTAPDTPAIASLRQRHETINGLQNRHDELVARIERTLVDVETLVAQTVAASFAGATSTGLDDSVRQLIEHAAALERAHREVAGLS